MNTVNEWKRRGAIDGGATSRLVSQEAEYPGPGPDMEPPSSEDVYDVDVNPDIDNPDVADDSGAPPFTGEDVEDVDEQRRRGPHSPTM